MAETIGEKLEDAGQKIVEGATHAGNKIAEGATKVGHKVSESFEEVTDWAKEKAHQVGHRAEETAQSVQNKARETFGQSCSSEQDRGVEGIKEHMDVYASCGSKIGRVDHVEGDLIKLTRNDSPDGQHHYIPTSWVSRVDSHVHLTKNSAAAEAEWK